MSPDAPQQRPPGLPHRPHTGAEVIAAIFLLFMGFAMLILGAVDLLWSGTMTVQVAIDSEFDGDPKVYWVLLGVFGGSTLLSLLSLVIAALPVWGCIKLLNQERSALPAISAFVVLLLPSLRTAMSCLSLSMVTAMVWPWVVLFGLLTFGVCVVVYVQARQRQIRESHG